jgi:hypothetical protein
MSMAGLQQALGGQVAMKATSSDISVGVSEDRLSQDSVIDKDNLQRQLL